jgi:calcineurin-like phosphoesterase family protein
MKIISRFTKTYLENTKVRQGDFDWDLYDMSYELTNEEEALRLLNGLIESIVTGNDTYTLESFKSDVQESIEQVNQ